MSQVPLSRAAQLVPFISLLDRIGAPIDRGIERHRLPPVLREEPLTLLSTYAHAAFVEDMALREGIDDFHWLEQCRDLSIIPGVARGVCRARTLFDALVVVTERARLDASGSKGWLEYQQDTISLHYRSAVLPGTPGADHLALIRTGVAISIVRLFAGPDWLPAECGLPFGGDIRPLLGSELGNLPIRRMADSGWIRIPRSLLALPPRPSQPIAAQIGTMDLETPAVDLVGSLEQALGPYACEGGPSIREAAALAGMSARSLQRHLARADISYRSLLQRVKFSLARELLARPDVKMAEIAREVGYRDQAHFTRFFRSYAGMCPTEYRASL